MTNLKHRLFFALWPDEPTRRLAAAVVTTLKPKLAAHWIRPANLHVTLAFLGEVEQPRIEAARAAADGIVCEPVRLHLDRLEHWRKPQVLCLTPTNPPQALLALAEDLADRLRKAGFALENRPYRPHLTLARKAHTLPADATVNQGLDWACEGFVLVESRQDGQGTVYSVLKAWPA